jgi:hypothetical protein
MNEAMPLSSERLDKEILWYEKKANRNLREFHSLKTLQIFLGSAIPIFSLVVPSDWWARVVTGVSGTTIAAIEAFLQLGHTEQNWHRWRSTAETLKRERALFLQAAGPYADPTSRNLPHVVLAERS